MTLHDQMIQKAKEKYGDEHVYPFAFGALTVIAERMFKMLSVADQNEIMHLYGLERPS